MPRKQARRIYSRSNRFRVLIHDSVIHLSHSCLLGKRAIIAATSTLLPSTATTVTSHHAVVSGARKTNSSQCGDDGQEGTTTLVDRKSRNNLRRRLRLSHVCCKQKVSGPHKPHFLGGATTLGRPADGLACERRRQQSAEYFLRVYETNKQRNFPFGCVTENRARFSRNNGVAFQRPTTNQRIRSARNATAR